MTDHIKIKQLLSVYFDGETSLDESKFIEDHIKTCSGCRKQLGDFKKLSGLFQSCDNEELSPDLDQTIRRHLREDSGKEKIMEIVKPKNRLLKYGFGAGVALSVILAMIFMQNYSQRTMQARVRDSSQFMNAGVVGTYVQRGVQGQLMSAADDIGAQYPRSNTNIAKFRVQRQQLAKVTSTQAAEQYEPYYLVSNYANKYEESKVGQLASVKVKEKVSFDGKRARGGFQESSYSPTLMEGFGSNSASAPALKRDKISGEVAAFGQGFGDSGTSQGVMEFEEERIYPQSPRVQQSYNTEEYAQIYENQFTQALSNPLSTFSIDVDTAAYSNVRRFLKRSTMPPANAVRIEEMVNYFDYNYPKPFFNQPFSITTNVAPAPWNTNHYLVQIGIQGKVLKEKQVPPSNLVFLVDVSGSMNQPNKLPLLKQSLMMMVDQLGSNERIAIVTYAGSTRVVLNSTLASNKYAIQSAINNLRSGGGTAGASGIQLAYQVARSNFIKKGNNRIVLATDGDFNVGVSSDSALVQLIESQRNDGIFLSILGFGTGNYKDSKMEKIADAGNGNYSYIDNIREGEKVLVRELGSTLFTIAKDVKIQVEFNPAQVSHYKLIGYENRMLAKEDFNNDFIDAGELGAGHTVTALYEIVPVNGSIGMPAPGVDPLVYQKRGFEIFANKDIMTVKLRYKEPDRYQSKLIKKVVKKNQISNQLRGELKFAAAVAEFGLLLRNSPSKGYASYDRVLINAQSSLGKDEFGYRREFIDLVQRAQRLDHRVMPMPYYPRVNSNGWNQNTQESNIQFK